MAEHINDLADRVKSRLTDTGVHDMAALEEAIRNEAIRNAGRRHSTQWGALSVAIAAIVALGSAVGWSQARAVDHEHRLTVVETDREPMREALSELRATTKDLARAVQELQLELAKRKP